MPIDPISFLEKKIASLSLDDYEIYTAESRLFSAQAKEGEVEMSEEAAERGVAVRLFRDGRCGFACSSDWDPAFLERMLLLSYNSLPLIEEGTRFDLPSSEVKGVKGEKGAPSAQEAGTEEKLEMALALEREAKRYDRRIRRVRDARYSGELKTVRLKNSRGLAAECSVSHHSLSLMVVAEGEEGTDQQMAWEDEFSPRFSGLDPKKIATSAAERAISSLGARPIATQRSPALLDPMVAASFLGVLSSSFLGDQVKKNRSALKDKLEKEIYAQEVTIVDDGRLPGGYATLPFDGEGTETRRNELVSKGVLRQFLYDARTATEVSRSSTGNALRPGFKEPPRVGPTNFFVEPGKGKLEDLLKEMGTGFWIRDVIGVHTADPVTGDFSLGASGIWIEGAKKTPVRGVTISGNLHELFKRVVRIGGEVRFYHCYGSPPLLVSGIDIGGL
jgi:PmbA protein